MSVLLWLAPGTASVADLLLSGFDTSRRVEVFVVMVCLPLVMTSAQFLITDTFLRRPPHTQYDTQQYIEPANVDFYGEDDAFVTPSVAGCFLCGTRAPQAAHGAAMGSHGVAVGDEMIVAGRHVYVRGQRHSRYRLSVSLGACRSESAGGRGNLRRVSSCSVYFQQAFLHSIVQSIGFEGIFQSEKTHCPSVLCMAVGRGCVTPTSAHSLYSAMATTAQPNDASLRWSTCTPAGAEPPDVRRACGSNGIVSLNGVPTGIRLWRTFSGESGDWRSGPGGVVARGGLLHPRGLG